MLSSPRQHLTQLKSTTAAYGKGVASLESLARSPTSQANLHLPESLNTRLTNAVSHLAKKDPGRNDGYQPRNFITSDHAGSGRQAQNMRAPIEKLTSLTSDVGER